MTLVPAGAAKKYKRCCGASTASPSSVRSQATTDDLDDRRYLLQLGWSEFVAEFVARLSAFLKTDVPPPSDITDADFTSGGYRGVVRVVPMVHRPTEGWGGLPKDLITFIRKSQEELIECLEDLASREAIVVVAEGFSGPVDTASIASAAKTDAALVQEMDGYGVGGFIMKNPDVPVIGGDLPSDLLAMHELVKRNLRNRDVHPVFNALQEYRNRYGVQVALHAARSLNRTPVLVFGSDHAEGIAHAARKVAPEVKLTLVPTIAAQSAHLFQPTSPLRRQR